MTTAMAFDLADVAFGPPQQVAPHPQTLPLVRDRIRRVLTSAPAYQALDVDQRRDLAKAMVNIGQYLVDAGGATHNAPVAVALDSPTPDTAGADFKGQGGDVAADSGTNTLTTAIGKVDFPKFVAGLIDGVFNSIVASSVKQMQAYAEMVKNVSKSVDEFMKDNVSQNQARDYLADRYPDHLEVDTTGDKPTIKPRQDADQDNLPDFFRDLGLSQPVDNLDQDTPEQVLMPAARQRMAIDRQHLLLTMVVMGINRLVVTDGSIKASVLFNLDTKDLVTRTATTTSDRTDTNQSNSKGNGFRFLNTLWTNTWEDNSTTNLTVSTVSTATNTASVDLHTKLSGDVNIRFKSETFPLDQVANILGLDKPEVPGAPTASAAVTGGTATGKLPAHTTATTPVIPVSPRA